MYKKGQKDGSKLDDDVDIPMTAEWPLWTEFGDHGAPYHVTAELDVGRVGRLRGLNAVSPYMKICLHFSELLISETTELLGDGNAASIEDMLGTI